MAHEFAHLVNRDATVLTLSSFLPMLVDDRSAGVLDGVPWWATWGALLAVCYPLAAPAVDASPLSPAYAGGFLALALVSLLLGGVVLGALAVPVAGLSRRLARSREFAADRAAALLTGDPAAVAAALETLQGTDRPATDARATGVATLCLLPGGFGTGAGQAGEADADARNVDRTGGADRAGDGLHLSTTAHPPTEKRIERLRELAATLESD